MEDGKNISGNDMNDDISRIASLWISVKDDLEAAKKEEAEKWKKGKT